METMPDEQAVTDPEDELAEQGWAWFTNDYSPDIGQIQHADVHGLPGAWSDDQARAFVLYELAHKDPAKFWRVFKHTLLAQCCEYVTRAESDLEYAKEARTQMESVLQVVDATKLGDADIDVNLPAFPPAWLCEVD